jgi:hypothetical protein
MDPTTLDAKNNPANPSQDHGAMSPDWQVISDILAGAKAVRAAGERYLPKYLKETEVAYRRRLASVPWRPEFESALEDMTARPFSKVLTVNEDANDVILGKPVSKDKKQRRGGFVDDVDGQGNSLHVFARETFRYGLAYGLEGIYVAFTNAEPVRTVAEAKIAGRRPYWVHIRGGDILDLRFEVIQGKSTPVMLRMKESIVEPDGPFGEQIVERVRVVELLPVGDGDGWGVFWTLWRKVKPVGAGISTQWVIEGQAQNRMIGISRIPFVPFFTAPKTSNYRVKPPLLDLADMQLEIYRELARADQIKELTGFPMLVGEGVPVPMAEQVVDALGNIVTTKPAPQLDVGPGVILFAPPSMDGKPGTWKYIQPDAATVKELRESTRDSIEAFRQLANQPMTRKSGNIVATAHAIDAGKAHSAIEAWAHLLADALNQALVFTAEWYAIPDTLTVVMPEINIPGVNGTAETSALAAAQARGVISKKTEATELARRGILGPDYDYDEDQEQIAEEREGLEAEAMIDPITGRPIPPADDPADPPDDPELDEE